MSVIVPIVNLENSEDLMAVSEFAESQEAPQGAVLRLYKETVDSLTRDIQLQIYLDGVVYQAKAADVHRGTEISVLGNTVMAIHGEDETHYDFTKRRKIALKESIDKAIQQLQKAGFVEGEIDGGMIIRGASTSSICRKGLNRIPDYDECLGCSQMRCTVRQLWKMMEQHHPEDIREYKAGLQ